MRLRSQHTNRITLAWVFEHAIAMAETKADGQAIGKLLAPLLTSEDIKDLNKRWPLPELDPTIGLVARTEKELLGPQKD